MKILVVDDSSFVRQCVRKYLLEQDTSNEIILADSGEEGFKFYQDTSPDLIITDLLMPGMGGEAFVKKVREIDKTTEIIVLTADVQKAVREEIESLQISAFLNKPLNKEMIFKTLSEMKG